MILEKVGKDLAEKLCKDDPVRKNIPFDWRVADCRREMFHLEERAVICVAHLSGIPTTEKKLLSLKPSTKPDKSSVFLFSKTSFIAKPLLDAKTEILDNPGKPKWPLYSGKDPAL